MNKNLRPAPLNLGRIDYLNCWPLYHQLQKRADGKLFQLHSGHPAALNQGLETGAIDLSPSSSMLPAVSPACDYFIMPDIAITSLSEVQSVILLSRRPPVQLTGCNIALTSHSLTSVFLLKIILFQFLGLAPQSLSFGTEELTGKEFTASPAVEAALIIGDQALELYHNPPAGFQVYDLGRLWHHYTGLPFVYALWLGRKAALTEKSQMIISLHRHLTQIAAELPGKLSQLTASALAEADRKSTISPSQLLAYWQAAISYRLDTPALAGLKLFYQYARELNLIDQVPELDFFPKTKDTDMMQGSY
ncbi:MAG: menaquinone biosynthesis protein [Deltaproteobacteria bacterium]|nr:menaquinone biosynthesis protein [Deltaproteobacteria bacterium]